MASVNVLEERNSFISSPKKTRRRRKSQTTDAKEVDHGDEFVDNKVADSSMVSICISVGDNSDSAANSSLHTATTQSSQSSHSSDGVSDNENNLDFVIPPTNPDEDVLQPPSPPRHLHQQVFKKLDIVTDKIETDSDSNSDASTNCESKSRTAKARTSKVKRHQGTSNSEQKASEHVVDVDFADAEDNEEDHETRQSKNETKPTSFNRWPRLPSTEAASNTAANTWSYLQNMVTVAKEKVPAAISTGVEAAASVITRVATSPGRPKKKTTQSRRPPRAQSSGRALGILIASAKARTPTSTPPRNKKWKVSPARTPEGYKHKPIPSVGGKMLTKAPAPPQRPCVCGKSVADCEELFQFRPADVWCTGKMLRAAEQAALDMLDAGMLTEKELTHIQNIHDVTEVASTLALTTAHSDMLKRVCLNGKYPSVENDLYDVPPGIQRDLLSQLPFCRNTILKSETEKEIVMVACQLRGIIMMTLLESTDNKVATKVFLRQGILPTCVSSLHAWVVHAKENLDSRNSEDMDSPIELLCAILQLCASVPVFKKPLLMVGAMSLLMKMQYMGFSPRITSISMAAMVNICIDFEMAKSYLFDHKTNKLLSKLTSSLRSLRVVEIIPTLALIRTMAIGSEIRRELLSPLIPALVQLLTSDDMSKNIKLKTAGVLRALVRENKTAKISVLQDENVLKEIRGLLGENKGSWSISLFKKRSDQDDVSALLAILENSKWMASKKLLSNSATLERINSKARQWAIQSYNLQLEKDVTEMAASTPIPTLQEDSESDDNYITPKDTGNDAMQRF
eukprot:m.10217 g.10217  ORF g.10217 m.10217 type:complete len:796 (-) comp4225_c0_seq1:45-2432(-)